MKKRLFLIATCFSLLMTGAVLVSCSSDDDTSKVYSESDINLLLETRIGNAEQGFQSLDDLPGWLREKVSYVTKNLDFYKEFPDLVTSVYQCEWKGEVLYFMPNPLESCYYCNTVFHSDGTMVEWNSIDETIDFASNSSSWKFIFRL